MEGERDERRGKKRGRGQMNIPSCAYAAGQTMVDSACALDHHHPCLALYVPLSFQNVCMRIPLVQQSIILLGGLHLSAVLILGVLSGLGTWHHCPNPRSTVLLPPLPQTPLISLARQHLLPLSAQQ